MGLREGPGRAGAGRCAVLCGGAGTAVDDPAAARAAARPNVFGLRARCGRQTEREEPSVAAYETSNDPVTWCATRDRAPRAAADRIDPQDGTRTKQRFPVLTAIFPAGKNMREGVGSARGGGGGRGTHREANILEA